MWAEFATDTKVQSMDETLQRRFVMLLCLHCNGEYERLDADEIACALRISVDEWERTRSVFQRKGFLDENGKIRNWNKRQFKSDTSTERVRKHREEQLKRKGNVSETPSENRLQTTETESKRVPSEPVALKRDDGAVDRVFEHWKLVHGHPKAHLDDKRRKIIRRALTRYSEADLCQAISGYRNSPHHMGQNDTGTVYDSLELFLRDSEHVDRGLKLYAEPPRIDLSPQTRRIISQTENWVPPEVRHAAN
jgi:hypothetical protein